MYCPNCNCDVSSTVRNISETYPVKGEDTTIMAQVCFCDRCNTELWDNDLDEKNLLTAFSKYRKKHKLLQPDEIRAIREKYHLSQTAFARVLGFGDKTITRYENGSIADAAQNNLIDLMQEPKNFLILLAKNRDKISEADYQEALSATKSYQPQIIYACIPKSHYRFASNSIAYSNESRGDLFA